MRELPDPHYQLLPGSWQKHSDVDTAGGPLIYCRKSKRTGKQENTTNTRWNQNPQYLLRLPAALGQSLVDIKITLRRTEKDNPKHGVKKRGQTTPQQQPGDKKPPNVGLVVCKPTQPMNVRRQRKRHSEEPRTNTFGEVVHARNGGRRHSPYQRRRGEEADGLAPLEAETRATLNSIVSPDQEGHVRRKLTVTNDEWYIQTHFVDPNESTVYLHAVSRAWMPEGILITPCLSERGTTGQFDLEIHSSHPVDFLQLPDAFAKSLADEWTTDTAGGSHLHRDTWKKNPKYSLRFAERSTPKRVQITLSRPMHHWTKHTKRDPVGTMIGFYVYSTSRPTRESSSIMVDGNPWTETAFVPLDEVSTPVHFTLPAPATQEDDFTIMPCTLDPNIRGPFFLSIVSDSEFGLHHQRERH